MTSPDLTVVLALDDRASLDGALDSLRLACRGMSSELIVVVAGAPVDVPAAGFTRVRVECRPQGTLVPHLWGAGLGAASGRIVAFTTGQLRVSAAWARSLLRALESGAYGAGGPISLMAGAPPSTAAAYLTRFSLFAPHLWPSPAGARDVAGDNAAYQREALLSHPDLVAEGFWEVEFHRRLEAAGRVLRMEPEARAEFVGPVAFGPLLQQRYRHGKEFGRSRVERHDEWRLKLLLAAPLVPIPLIARAGRRVLPARPNRRIFVRALPRLALLSGAWALGEAAGAATARCGPTR
jgi:hypothetical protein